MSKISKVTGPPLKMYASFPVALMAGDIRLYSDTLVASLYSAAYQPRASDLGYHAIPTAAVSESTMATNGPQILAHPKFVGNEGGAAVYVDPIEFHIYEPFAATSIVVYSLTSRMNDLIGWIPLLPDGKALRLKPGDTLRIDWSDAGMVSLELVPEQPLGVAEATLPEDLERQLTSARAALDAFIGVFGTEKGGR